MHWTRSFYYSRDWYNEEYLPHVIFFFFFEGQGKSDDFKFDPQIRRM